MVGVSVTITMYNEMGHIISIFQTFHFYPPYCCLRLKIKVKHLEDASYMISEAIETQVLPNKIVTASVFLLPKNARIFQDQKCPCTIAEGLSCLINYNVNNNY